MEKYQSLGMLIFCQKSSDIHESQVKLPKGFNVGRLSELLEPLQKILLLEIEHHLTLCCSIGFRGNLAYGIDLGPGGRHAKIKESFESRFMGILKMRTIVKDHMGLILLIKCCGFLRDVE